MPAEWSARRRRTDPSSDVTWFEGAGAARLEHDKATVAEDQPNLRYVVRPDGSLSLVGDVTFKLRHGGPQRIPTRIDFPEDYPEREPRAYQTPKRFPRGSKHHFYDDGQACLWLDVETKWRSSDPDALRMFLDQLCLFYLRQLAMEANPNLPFPGPARGHGVFGYIEYLEERLRMPRRKLSRMLPAMSGGVYRNAPCPCGRRVRYRKCHREAIRRFKERADPRHQRLVIQELETIARSRTSRSRVVPGRDGTESGPLRRNETLSHSQPAGGRRQAGLPDHTPTASRARSVSHARCGPGREVLGGLVDTIGPLGLLAFGARHDG